jgi:chemotaxis protein histidine kinase CheA
MSASLKQLLDNLTDKQKLKVRDDRATLRSELNGAALTALLLFEEELAKEAKQEQERADRLAKEEKKEEQERAVRLAKVAKEEQERADRLASEAQERADRLAKEEKEEQERADRLAKEEKKQEQERADKLAKEAKEEQERADKLAREEKKQEQERADRLAKEEKKQEQERADRLAREAQERNDRLAKETREAQAKRGDNSLVSTPSEIYKATNGSRVAWSLMYEREAQRDCTYNTASEETVQTEMIKALEKIAESCGLKCHDTHTCGVRKLHKPDAVFTLGASSEHMISARVVVFMAEFTARAERKDGAVRTFTFPPDEMGQVVDKLLRLRNVRDYDDLFAMLSNGFHYQLFKLDGAGVLHETRVHTLHDVGPLKAAMALAKGSLEDKFWFVEILQKNGDFRGMGAQAMLGAGAHCRAWKCANSERSIAVVVAETADTSDHLLHNYRVFEALAASREDDNVLLYTPLWKWMSYDGSKALAVFAQAGERWTASMFREMKLTRQDVLDIADQIEHFHRNGYIHCDIALRNFVRYQAPDGEFHSVLIDAGAAVNVKRGEKWRGGTVNNASIAWLMANLDKVEASDHANVTVPSKEDELWSFVLAVMDMCFPTPSDRREIIECRKQRIGIGALAAIPTLLRGEIKYTEVANAVADMLLLPKHEKAKLSSSKGSPEHPSTLQATTPPASPALAAQTPVKHTRKIKKKKKDKANEKL